MVTASGAHAGPFNLSRPIARQAASFMPGSVRSCRVREAGGPA